MNRPDLEFPLHWEYKIIACRTDQALAAICDVISAHGFTSAPKPGSVSRNGSYVTYSLTMRLDSLDQLDSLTQALSSCHGVKYLL